MAAKSRLNKAIIEKAIKGSGGIFTKIAESVDVPRMTVYDFIRKDEELLKLVKQEKSMHLDRAESIFTKLIDKTNRMLESGQIDYALLDRGLSSSKYVLSTIGKGRGYTEKHEIDTQFGFDKDAKDLLQKMFDDYNA